MSMPPTVKMSARSSAMQVMASSFLTWSTVRDSACCIASLLLAIPSATPLMRWWPTSSRLCLRPSRAAVNCNGSKKLCPLVAELVSSSRSKVDRIRVCNVFSHWENLATWLHGPLYTSLHCTGALRQCASGFGCKARCDCIQYAAWWNSFSLQHRPGGKWVHVYRNQSWLVRDQGLPSASRYFTTSVPHQKSQWKAFYGKKGSSERNILPPGLEPGRSGEIRVS